MSLKTGAAYRVYMQDLSIYRLVVISDEGGGWYKVKSGGETFFLNLNQAIRVFEE